MLLAHLHARRGDARTTASVLEDALDFYGRVEGDFEVKVNFRLKPWLNRARDACHGGALERIRIYDFAY